MESHIANTGTHLNTSKLGVCKALRFKCLEVLNRMYNVLQGYFQSRQEGKIIAEYFGGDLKLRHASKGLNSECRIHDNQGDHMLNSIIQYIGTLSK